MIDVGLLGAMSDLDINSILGDDELFVEFKGALTEQYVLQQIISTTEMVPYYYSNTNSRNEIDFLMQIKSDIVPIEVKAEENLKSKSLKAYIDKYDPKYAIRFSMKDYIKQEVIINIPLWNISAIGEI